MKEYRRLKSIDGSGTIMRYYELKDDLAYTNCFYEIKDGKAEKIEGAASGNLIGFSHGGNALAKGLIFLDINPSVVYMGILEDDEEGPAIGDIVNGYQKVIDTHYDDDTASGKGTNPEEWGIETLDNPYYLFTIVQPEGSEATVDDAEAGTLTPAQGGVGGGAAPASGKAVLKFHYVFNNGDELISNLAIKSKTIYQGAEDEPEYRNLSPMFDLYLGAIGTRETSNLTEFEIGKALSEYFTVLEYGEYDNMAEPGEEWTKLGDIDLAQVINAAVYEIDIDPLVSDGE